MWWLRRLLPSDTKVSVLRSQKLPAIVTKEGENPANFAGIRAYLRQAIKNFPEVPEQSQGALCEAVLSAPLNLHLLCIELEKISDVDRSRAAEIARSLSRKASTLMGREHKASLGFIHAIWLYPNAPCMKETSSLPTAEDAQQDAAHKAANGQFFEIAKGMYVNGKWTLPGLEDGCKCGAKSVISGLE